MRSCAPARQHRMILAHNSFLFRLLVFSLSVPTIVNMHISFFPTSIQVVFSNRPSGSQNLGAHKPLLDRAHPLSQHKQVQRQHFQGTSRWFALFMLCFCFSRWSRRSRYCNLVRDTFHNEFPHANICVFSRSIFFFRHLVYWVFFLSGFIFCNVCVPCNFKRFVMRCCNR